MLHLGVLSHVRAAARSTASRRVLLDGLRHDPPPVQSQARQLDGLRRELLQRLGGGATSGVSTDSGCADSDDSTNSGAMDSGCVAGVISLVSDAQASAVSLLSDAPREETRVNVLGTC